MLGTAAAIFSVLLVTSGVAKVRKPGDTTRAVRSMGMAVPESTGRVVGLVELGVGLGALIVGSPALWSAQAVLYAAFLVWVAVAIGRDVPIASCGCLGSPDTPPYWGHLVVNSFAVFLSSMAAFTSSRIAFSGGGGLVATVGLVAVGSWLAWTVIGDGARLHGAVHS